MKILWFTNTCSLYDKNNNSYNGGGWIESLEKIIGVHPEIELGISFFHQDKCFKKQIGKTTYYPIPLYSSKLQKAKRLTLLHNDKKEISYYLSVVNDFKPDLIHVFGSEQSFGLLGKHTKVPLVIHLQGILNPCLNAYYAPGYSSLDIVKNNILHPIKLLLNQYGFKKFKYNASREAIILSSCKFFMGRTDWDKNISELYAPNSNYFNCGEILRDIFYQIEPWRRSEKTTFKIISTISKATYKGFDLILKTARLLVDLGDIDFEWNVYGVSEYIEWEKKLNIKCNKVNINLKGVVNSVTLANNIKESDVFIHPSYIDNSPNSVCEAQIIGIPVIAANVGGLSSLITNSTTGILVPANDPFTLAKKIIDLKNATEYPTSLGKHARETALIRHNKITICNTLLSIYKNIIDAENIN